MRSRPRHKGWKVDAGGQAESSPVFTPGKAVPSSTRCAGRAGGHAEGLLLKAGREELEKEGEQRGWGSENTVCFQEECFPPGALLCPHG